MPYAIKVDSGPAFRVTFERELEEIYEWILKEICERKQKKDLKVFKNKLKMFFRVFFDANCKIFFKK